MRVMRPGIHVLAAGGNSRVADLPAVLKNRRR
jgi:hypothetical protein